MPETTSPPQVSRRSILSTLINLGVLGWLTSALYPVVRYLKPLPLAGPGGPVRLTPSEVAKVEREKFAIVRVGYSRILVLEDPDGELHALDAKCTHEGYTVQYRPGDGLIRCACHNARFDIQGRVLSGPPPRPLPRHTVQRDDDGVIRVLVEKT